MVKIFFNTAEGKVEVNADEGLSVLEVAHQNNIELEGACEGSLACSTCHVILEQDQYDKLSQNDNTQASEDEEDMLDLAFGLTSTSRLGCQIIVNKDIEGFVFSLPPKTRNIKS